MSLTFSVSFAIANFDESEEVNVEYDTGSEDINIILVDNTD